MARVPALLRARVQVPTRPDWYFVKLHAHGAEQTSQNALLGEPMVRFHQQLAEESRRNPAFHYHYVTAREMYNLIKAAEARWSGNVVDALDFELVWNGKAACQVPNQAWQVNDLPHLSCQPDTNPTCAAALPER
jgi:hypothetical protein